MGAKRITIFSWSRLAKLSGIHYRQFTERRLTDEEKKQLIPIIEQGIGKLLEGQYKLFKVNSNSVSHIIDKE